MINDKIKQYFKKKEIDLDEFDDILLQILMHFLYYQDITPDTFI